MACEVLDVRVPAVEVLPLGSAVRIDDGRVGPVGFDVGGDVEEAGDRRLILSRVDDQVWLDEVVLV